MAWWKLGVVKIESGKLWVGDAQFAPSAEDGLVVDVPPGDYEVRTREPFVRGGAREMRTYLVGSKFKRGAELGETWADTGTHGVCDQVAVAAIEQAVGESFPDLFMDAYEKEATGMFYFDPAKTAGMAWSGVEGGDGRWPVYELLDPAGIRCGIEVDFQGEEESV